MLANQRDVGPQPVERGVVVERPASIDRDAWVGHIVLHLDHYVVGNFKAGIIQSLVSLTVQVKCGKQNQMQT